jgi:hypothetical protein
LKGGKSSPLAHNRIDKIARVNGMVNWVYENAVNAQREREATDGETIEHFIAHPRKWGQRCHKTAFVRHIPKGTDERRVYAELKVNKSLCHQWLIDGMPVGDDEILPFLREKSESSRQQVENPVILRDYRLSSIEYITFGGESFAVKVTPDDEAELYETLGQ